MKTVGVRFKSGGKIYTFDSGSYVLKRGDHVIVETEGGLMFGTVAVPPALCDETSPPQEYKKVFRPAMEQDLEQLKQNKELEERALKFCAACIRQLGLHMNLFAVESTFDTTKLTFFFTADGRVDFRELVKLLVKEFHTRIEMRQVGIRNQAKMCGGIGRCGREVCCSTFLEKFEPVSIRMAKEQNLSLNPTKISGLCGRLMCCLTYENETYQVLKTHFPKIGAIVDSPNGRGKVTRQNVIGNRIAILLDSGQEIEVELDSVQIQDETPLQQPTLQPSEPDVEPNNEEIELMNNVF